MNAVADLVPPGGSLGPDATRITPANGLLQPFVSELMPFGTLDARDRKCVILRVAWICQSRWKWAQHVDVGGGLGGHHGHWHVRDVAMPRRATEHACCAQAARSSSPKQQTPIADAFASICVLPSESWRFLKRARMIASSAK